MKDDIITECQFNKKKKKGICVNTQNNEIIPDTIKIYNENQFNKLKIDKNIKIRNNLYDNKNFNLYSLSNIIYKSQFFQKPIIFLIGFLIGWFGTYYMVNHLYDITGCICIGGVHIHHLYIGFIIGSIFLFLQYRFRKNIGLSLIFTFIMGFGFGMMWDDIMDHFIIRNDPFEFYCGCYC